MKMSFTFLAVAALAIGAPSHAMLQEEAPGVAGADEAGEDPDQRVRCQTRRVTGSNARRVRTCLTIAEWSELARTGNRDARRVVDESTRDSIQRGQ